MEIGRDPAQPPEAIPQGRSAFTLVELIIVLAIISLLATIMLPSLLRSRAMAGRVLCANNLRCIYTAATMYLQDNDDYFPCTQDPVSTKPFYWLWMGRGWRGLIAPYLSETPSERNPSVLYCKWDAAPSSKYESTSYAYSLSFYHSPEQINTMNKAADTYSSPQPSIPQRLGAVVEPGRKLFIGEWTSNHEPTRNPDKGWWCWEGARTFLLVDGTTQYLPAGQIRRARDGLPDPNLTFDGIAGRDL